MVAVVDKHRFDISLEDLQTFLAVAEMGSFRRAADHLALSQPSISNRIKRLEEKLGVRLLDRTTRTVTTTPAGHRLRHRAAQTLVGLRDLMRDFHVEAGHARSRVDVSATMMIATILLPPIVAAFAETNPDVTVRIKDRSPADAVAAVLEGRSDMAVMTLKHDNPLLRFEPLVADRCVAITSLDHPLRAEEPTLERILRYPLLSPEGHTSLRDAIDKEAARQNLHAIYAPAANGVSNTMTLLAMATAGLGVLLHPSTMIPPEFRKTIVTLEIADCHLARTYGLVSARSRTLSPAAQLFSDKLRTSVVSAR